MLYENLEGKKVRCALCLHRCVIPAGRRGFCGVRENQGGKLYSLVWGKPCSWATDPIEKKPFFHFFPGSLAFSLATVGCNFRCANCQNWEISQPKEISGYDILPEKLVEMAKKTDGIAYTYTEPTIFFEYANDCSKLARSQGLFNVFVTNGYMSEETIREMKYVDASRIDLKAFNEKFYKEVCKARLEPVLNSIKLLHARGHVEIINLIIPTLNDSPEEIREMCKWIVSLDTDIPLHFSAYHPSHKMTLLPTPIKTLEMARSVALEEGLRYVYVGNSPGHPGENTYCYNCNEMLIQRVGFGVARNALNDGKCPKCGAKINIITTLDWMK